MHDAAPSATVIAHVTDAHVAPGGRRSAVLKDLSVAILGDLTAQIAALQPDAVIFGGDNIDNKDDGRADLDAFMRLTEPLGRWLCILGNHETKHSVPTAGRISREAFLERVDGHGIGPNRPQFSERVGQVRVIGIDTTLVGTGGGHVSQKTMDFLARALREAEEEHILVVGHHLLARPWAPYRLDLWDREYLVDNHGEVASLLASHPRVRAYLCGHHHACRIDRIAGRGDTGGFYHIVTPAPAAYPLGARVLRFEAEELVIQMLRPRIEGVEEAALEAVMSGRKAQRFSVLGSAGSFSDYVRGRPSDNDVRLPYNLQRTMRLRLDSYARRAG